MKPGILDPVKDEATKNTLRVLRAHRYVAVTSSADGPCSMAGAVIGGRYRIPDIRVTSVCTPF